MLLQRALKDAEQTAQSADSVAPQNAMEAIEERDTKLCANCFNAKTFKDTDSRMMTRCAQDLWLRPAYTLEDLNNNRVRRWHADCPEYDDEE
ncbi:MAG: hypothetical protein AVDCRST_MAG77-5943 [uncultured Chloroflexi bacterium]|uniref:Uncharacterized protein n=1 Tax=uncultured Chloroflexota bacterium TaxID=166587 RepID=A0A6J4KAE3_9CHLR|nr:MAG: hypothetical protein AVDCRST_MAG77-5943 [uncultured Chloroflexota bacterium]